jgi:hypothetical protein
MLGKPASMPQAAADDIEDFGFYRNRRGKKRWGVPPKQSNEIKSIAEDYIEEKSDLPSGFKWEDSSNSID